MKNTKRTYILIAGFLGGFALPQVAHAGPYNGTTCDNYDTCNTLISDCESNNDHFTPTDYDAAGGGHWRLLRHLHLNAIVHGSS